MRNTFKVYERLKKEQHIDTLFRSGKAFSVFPIRLIYNVIPRSAGRLSPVLTGFSVPKKKFPGSVERHRIRRLMVEAWRLNKHTLYEAIPEGIQLHLFLTFTDTNMPTLDLVREAIIKGISKLIQTLNTNSQSPTPNSQ